MIGIFSDAHGNIAGFQLAIKFMRQLRVEEFYYLGDSVGYLPLLDVVTALQRMGNCVNCIMGNHEKMLLGCSGDDRVDPAYQHEDLRDRIKPGQEDFIRSWPTHRHVRLGKQQALMVHGGPRDYTNEYIYPDTDLGTISVKEALVFMGHSHRPFIRVHGETTFINVGSCGLPRDDGRYGAFAVFDPERQKATVFRYDISGWFEGLGEADRSTIHSTVTQMISRRTTQLYGELIT